MAETDFQALMDRGILFVRAMDAIKRMTDPADILDRQLTQMLRIIAEMKAKGPQYKSFCELTDEQYPHCTLTEKLTVYLQHHPIRAVAFLEELICAIHPEKPHDHPSTD